MITTQIPGSPNCTTVAFWYNEPDMALIFSQRMIPVLFFCLFWTPSQEAFAGKASETVMYLQETILEIMKDGDTLGYQGRYKIITPVIDLTHDLPVIARIAIGRHWKNLTKEQQVEFTSTFQELSHSTYAARFNSYSREQFVLISEKPLKRNRKLVQTRFVKADGEEIRFNYILHQVQDQWKIINIMVNGVSDLALKRTEYGGILKKDGYTTLIKKLRAQIQESANGL